MKLPTSWKGGFASSGKSFWADFVAARGRSYNSSVDPRYVICAVAEEESRYYHPYAVRNESVPTEKS